MRKKKANIPFNIGVAVITDTEIEVPIYHLPSGQLLGTIKGKVKLAKPKTKKGKQ